MAKSNTQEETITDTGITEPSQYKVLLHNDDKTTMEFVIVLLMDTFHRDFKDAHEITMCVHETGIGIAGIYPREIAEEKTEASLMMARSHGYPLMITFEEL